MKITHLCWRNRDSWNGYVEFHNLLLWSPWVANDSYYMEFQNATLVSYGDCWDHEYFLSSSKHLFREVQPAIEMGSVNFLVGFSTSQSLPLMSSSGHCDSCPVA